MNAKGYRETGRRMLESVIAKWPLESLPIVVYAEDFEIDDLPAVEVRHLPAWLAEFKARHANVPAYNGRRNGVYDYRFDAVKFSHKVAALTDFGLEIEPNDILIWLDADTFTHASVTNEWLASLFPGSSYIAWLDRANSHPECGFVMFRCSHPYHSNFMTAFRNLYTSGDLFKLRETHDSFALQHMVTAKVMNRKIPAPVSLSGDRNWHHPFVSGPLGACLDHCKGPSRKLTGKSHPRDLRKPRSEPYWRQA